MKIKMIESVCFETLGYGEIFLHDGEVYIKIVPRNTEWTAVHLKTGQPILIYNSDLVHPKPSAYLAEG